MANATETQAGGLDPDLSQKGYGLGVSSQCPPLRTFRVSQEGHPLCSTTASTCDGSRAKSSKNFRPIQGEGFVEVLFRITIRV